jgi:hypothetical protein
MNLWASLAVVLLVIPTFAVAAMVEGSATGNGPPVAFTVAWLGIAALVWYYVLFTGVIEVRLWSDDGRLEFRSFLRKRETNVSYVVEIDCSRWNRGVSIRYRDGGYRRSVARLGNEKAARDLIQRIEECYATVEVKRRPLTPGARSASANCRSALTGNGSRAGNLCGRDRESVIVVGSATLSVARNPVQF